VLPRPYLFSMAHLCKWLKITEALYKAC